MGLLPLRGKVERLEGKESGTDEEISAYGTIYLMTKALHTTISFISDSVGKEQSMRVLREAVTFLMGLPQECRLKEFIVITIRLDE